jgi:predicted TIM-barrel fold metal-dependent hydrolase
MKGCGVTHAVLLTLAVDEEKARAEVNKAKRNLARSVAANPAEAGVDQVFRKAVGSGAVLIGELKYPLALESPEMGRVYEIAAELRVPVMMHIENYPAAYSKGYERFDKVLQAYRRTTFIGHGPQFWAHISADVPAANGYPAGPVKPGGLTDRWLTEFPNFYADMSANSGRNALARDEDFARDFVVRQRDKLIFGSDCPCSDGNGGGLAKGKGPGCIARATLEILKRASPPEVFRKITWTNGAKMFGMIGRA